MMRFLVVMTFSIAGCANVPEATELQQDGVAVAVRPSETYDAMLSHGVFTLANGCVSLHVEGLGRHTPVFSSEVAVDASRANGRRVLPLDKRVSLGGSAISAELSQQLLSGEFRQRCAGPYFAVGPISEGRSVEPPAPPPGPPRTL